MLAHWLETAVPWSVTGEWALPREGAVFHARASGAVRLGDAS